jgi:ferredoxin
MPSDPPALSRSKRTNAAEVRRAAAHPDRPGEGCKAEPGAFAPIVDRGRCEGKGDCLVACPESALRLARRP